MKTRKVTKYVATDDKEFDTRIECQKHDLTLHIRKALIERFGDNFSAAPPRPSEVAEFIANRYNIKFPSGPSV